MEFDVLKLFFFFLLNNIVVMFHEASTPCTLKYSMRYVCMYVAITSTILLQVCLDM